MKIDILTLFPEITDQLINYSILSRAIEKDIVDISSTDIREFSKDKHKKVDDYPYGGGPGMVMGPQPIDDCLDHIETTNTHVVYMSPRGQVLDQNKAKALSQKSHIAIICGHYEGIDQRIIDTRVDEEISIGDYILTGGELAAMVVVDSVVRLLDGALGNDQSSTDESFENYLLEHDQYTRPQIYKNLEVPPVLLSGNHQEIENYRHNNSLQITKERRPDLYKKYISQKDK